MSWTKKKRELHSNLGNCTQKTAGYTCVIVRVDHIFNTEIVANIFIIKCNNIYGLKIYQTSLMTITNNLQMIMLSMQFNAKVIFVSALASVA